MSRYHHGFVWLSCALEYVCVSRRTLQLLILFLKRLVSFFFLLDFSATASAKHNIQCSPTENSRQIMPIVSILSRFRRSRATPSWLYPFDKNNNTHTNEAFEITIHSNAVHIIMDMYSRTFKLLSLRILLPCSWKLEESNIRSVLHRIIRVLDRSC